MPDLISQAQSAPLSEPSTNPFMQILTRLKEAFVDLGGSMIDFLPSIIVAVIIILIGLLIAKIVRSIATKVLEGVKIDAIVEKTGLQDSLSKMGVKGSLAVLLPKILYVFIVVFMIKTAADSAGFSDISGFIGTIFAFIPKIIMAFIIMLVAMFVGEIIQNTIFNTLDAKGIDYAATLSKIAFGLVFVIFLTVALSQLGIETELLKDSVKIIIAGVALALALALGLGLKSHANNIVAAVYVRDIYRQGSSIEIDGELLSIKGTGPVTTKLQKESGEFIVIPNSELIANKVKGKA